MGTGIVTMSMCCALMGIFRAAGYSSSIKSLPTSDGHRRADLHVVGAHLMGKDDLMVDVTVRHDFIGDARDVLRHGTLRNPDRPDQLLNQAAADKIRSYREPYSRNRSLAFLPACMSTSGRIHSEFLRLPTSLRTSRRQTTSRPSAMSLTRRSTATAAASTSTSIAAPLAWRVLRLLRSVVPPTLRAVMLLCLVPCNSVLLSTIGTATTFMSVSELKAQ